MKKIIILSILLLSYLSGFPQSGKSEFLGSDNDKGNIGNYLKFGSKTDEKLINDDQKFRPTINLGLGIVGTTTFSQADPVDKPGDSKYNFQPADFKIGFLHADATVTKNFNVGFSINMHTGAPNKITDAFFKYTPSPYFGIQAGRFKGAGNRAAHETSAYDLDLADFAYIAETQSVDKGAPDLRHYGIDLFGKYKWIKYSFFWHKSNKDRTRYWSQVINAPVRGNHGVSLKNWDLSLRFTPLNFLEFGGHVGMMSRPGMGGETKPLYSAFLYYIQPNRFKIKFDYVKHHRVIFEDNVVPAQNDYLLYPYHTEKKQGFSILAGGFINKHIEPIARFEHFNEGKNAVIGYEALNIYTVGINYYPFPESPRVGKLTLFYQKKDERNGIKLNNDWFGLQYQVVLFSKIPAK